MKKNYKKLAFAAALFGVCAISLAPTAYADVTFSGNIADDFPAENCFLDVGYNPECSVVSDFPDESCFSGTTTNDVGINPEVADLVPFTGFDINMFCIQYDPATDKLYVGVSAQIDPASGFPIPFGDVDGDGDAGAIAPNVQAASSGHELIDSADMGYGEHFHFILDLDTKLDSTPDLLAGISLSRDLSQFTVSDINQDFLNSFPAKVRSRLVSLLPLGILDEFYGTPFEEITGEVAFPAAMFSSNKAVTSKTGDFEFTISGLSFLAGFSAIDFTNPATKIAFAAFAGSKSSGLIGDDFFARLLSASKMLPPAGASPATSSGSSGSGTTPVTPTTTPATTLPAGLGVYGNGCTLIPQN